MVAVSIIHHLEKYFYLQVEKSSFRGYKYILYKAPSVKTSKP